VVGGNKLAVVLEEWFLHVTKKSDRYPNNKSCYKQDNIT